MERNLSTAPFMGGRNIAIYLQVYTINSIRNFLIHVFLLKNLILQRRVGSGIYKLIAEHVISNIVVRVLSSLANVGQRCQMNKFVHTIGKIFPAQICGALCVREILIRSTSQYLAVWKKDCTMSVWIVFPPRPPRYANRLGSQMETGLLGGRKLLQCGRNH